MTGLNKTLLHFLLTIFRFSGVLVSEMKSNEKQSPYSKSENNDRGENEGSLNLN